MTIVSGMILMHKFGFKLTSHGKSEIVMGDSFFIIKKKRNSKRNICSDKEISIRYMKLLIEGVHGQ